MAASVGGASGKGPIEEENRTRTQKGKRSAPSVVEKVKKAKVTQEAPPPTTGKKRSVKVGEAQSSKVARRATVMEITPTATSAVSPLQKSSSKASALFQEHVSQAIKSYLSAPTKLASLPRAEDGKAAVYLPKDLPIVLKQPTDEQLPGAGRLEKMEYARSLCQDHNTERLTVPDARLHGPFIIESRVPIGPVGIIYQIGLYCENREKFAQAAKEFVRFCCFADFKDTFGGSALKFARLSEERMAPRFDNIPLYIAQEKGNVALIDTEHLAKGSTKPGSKEVLAAVENGLRLFPFHKEAILEEARLHDPQIDQQIARIDAVQQKSERFYNLFYTDHKSWLETKKIDPSHANQPLNIPPKQREELKVVLVNELKKELKRNVLMKVWPDHPSLHNTPETIEQSEILKARMQNKELEKKVQTELEKAPNAESYIATHGDTMIDLVFGMTNQKLASHHSEISSKTAAVDFSLAHALDARTFNLDLNDAYNKFFTQKENFDRLQSCHVYRFTHNNETHKFGPAYEGGEDMDFIKKITLPLLKHLQGQEIFQCKQPYTDLTDQLILLI